LSTAFGALLLNVAVLSDSVEKFLNDDANPVEGKDLLVWEERLFDLRRTAPEIPAVLYKLRRKFNERAMHSAANQLSRRAGGGRNDGIHSYGHVQQVR
jgi:hypothetical protein